MQQIVIVWTDTTGLRPTGRFVERDRNLFPEFEACPQAHACIWLKKGTEADVEKAQAYIASERHDKPDIAVKTYSVYEADVLGRAKREILAELTAATEGKQKAR